MIKSYTHITEAASELVLETGRFIKNELGKVGSSDIEIKDRNSLVSYVDKEAEKMLVSGLSKILPEAKYITEEGTVANSIDAPLTWIIDPLDGTSNFLHNLPHFAVSVGLKEGNQIVSGIILSVVSGELFTASYGEGAYLNGEAIHVSRTTSIENAMIATGFPYQIKDVEPMINTLGYFMKHARGLRRYGAAALDLAFVAAGRYDCYYETNLNAWDVAAGVLLVTEAGGSISDFQGQDNYLFGQTLIASNGRIQDQVQAVIKKNFI